jgi:hypothetical protein
MGSSSSPTFFIFYRRYSRNLKPGLAFPTRTPGDFHGDQRRENPLFPVAKQSKKLIFSTKKPSASSVHRTHFLMP